MVFHLPTRFLYSILVGCIVLIGSCSDDTAPGRYVGYVEAEYLYIISPQPGWIEVMAIGEGDTVTPNTELFALDTDQQNSQLQEADARLSQAKAIARDLSTGARREEIQALEADLAEARAQLSLADAERKRWQPLVKNGTASKARGDQVETEYAAARAGVVRAEKKIQVARLAGRDATRDAANAAVDSAQAGVAQVQWQLDQRSVKSRTTGRIEEVFHRVGEFVTVGAPVVAILPKDGLKVRFFAPQADLSTLHMGTQVLVHADGVPAPINGTISFVAREAEFTPPVIYSVGSRDRLVFLVEAKVPANTGLHPGLPVDISLP